MQKFKIYSLEVFEDAGFEIQISANNYGGVLIVAKNDIFHYIAVRYFSSFKPGEEWLDSLVNSTRAMCRYISK